MYKKAIGLLVLGNLIYLMGLMCVRGVETLKLPTQPVSQIQLELTDFETESVVEQTAVDDTVLMDDFSSELGIGIMELAVSGQRIVDYDMMVQPEFVYELSEEDLEALLRIVEAEAGSEDEDGRLLVANVVLNRVNSENFPATVKDVVFQQSEGVTQFSPVASGRYYTVEISEETMAAVGRALTGEDISQGALYFASRKYANSEKMRWFDTKLTFLFEHGGHEFFK